MNWKSYVEKQNEKTYVMPEGWTERDVVAEDLGCSPERVDEQLRPGLKSGEIEKQQFRVWDKQLKKVVIKVGYRKGGATAEKTPQADWSDKDLAKARALRAAGKSFAQIAAALGRTKSSVRHRLAA